MARTKVKGGKKRILGVLERARAVEVGGLEGRVFLRVLLESGWSS